MTNRQELELILTLIKKYHLPISPILEYAIKEKMEEYPEEKESIEEEIPQPQTHKVDEKASSDNKLTLTDDLEIEDVYLDSRGKVIKTIPSSLNASKEETSTEDSRRGKAWTEEEERLIKFYFLRGKDYSTIAELIGRTEIAIKARLAKLGLIDYTYGQKNEVTIDITKSPMYFERKQGILRALRFLRLPATLRDIARTISRTTWGGTIKEEDVKRIISTLPEVTTIEGRYVLRDRL